MYRGGHQGQEQGHQGQPAQPPVRSYRQEQMRALEHALRVLLEPGGMSPQEVTAMVESIILKCRPDAQPMEHRLQTLENNYHYAVSGLVSHQRHHFQDHTLPEINFLRARVSELEHQVQELRATVLGEQGGEYPVPKQEGA